MNSDDTPPLFGTIAFDILAGVGLLTRLPAPVDPGRAAARGAAAAWAWPVAGAIVGAAGALAGSMALWLGVPLGIAAAVVLACQMVVTGALHEDGLADSADGLWGGWDKARRLAIMKDSHIGTYGVLALLIVTLMRWTALTVVLGHGAQWWVLIAAGALSRAPMAVLMAALPNARGSGLSQSVGRPGRAVAGRGVLLALAVGTLCLHLGVVPAALAVAGVCVAVALIARAKIGGQTGDILGASQQLAEVVVLACAAAHLGA